MKRVRNVCVALSLAVLPLAADPLSYVVLSSSPGAILQRISTYGPITNVASVPQGLAVAKDTAGNYMVVTGAGLLQVTPAGVVTTVAKAPSSPVTSSWWTAVASDGLGSVLVGDNTLHAVWLITPGVTPVVQKIANYSVTVSGGGEDIAMAVDPSGNYVVLEDNASTVNMFSITPGGAVSPILISGAAATSVGANLIPDGAGNYVFVSWRDNEVCKVSAAGVVTVVVSNVGSGGDYPTSVAPDPDTGDMYVTTHGGLIVHINAQGTFINEVAAIPAARDIIAETYGDLPQLAAGGIWTTGFYVLNTGNLPASYWVGFFADPSGNSVALPFSSGNFSALQGTLPAHGMTYVETANTNAPLVVASGLISADPSITVQALFREHSSIDGKYYEAGVAASGGSTAFTFPFDDTTFAPTGDSLFTGFALANMDGGNAANVTCTATDNTGTVVHNALPLSQIAPLGHYSAFEFPALTGKRGTVACSSDTRVAAIALRVIGATALSSLPVLYE